MLPDLDPVIHQPTRLQILTLLYRNRRASFIDLRDGLRLTPGNLASHAARLEEAGYVQSGRVLVDLSFEVHYRITEQGSAAFRAYLDALRSFLQAAESPALPPAEAARDASGDPSSSPR
jgi:DNA-binding MarR family transcriptional regulator